MHPLKQRFSSHQSHQLPVRNAGTPHTRHLLDSEILDEAQQTVSVAKVFVLSTRATSTLVMVSFGLENFLIL